MKVEDRPRALSSSRSSALVVDRAPARFLPSKRQRTGRRDAPPLATSSRSRIGGQQLRPPESRATVRPHSGAPTRAPADATRPPVHMHMHTLPLSGTKPKLPSRSSATSAPGVSIGGCACCAPTSVHRNRTCAAESTGGRTESSIIYGSRRCCIIIITIEEIARLL